jgi:tetratricopeptide (TPR) repeat protein
MGSVRSVIRLFCLAVILLGFAGQTRASEGLLEKGISEYQAENYEEAIVSLTKATEEQPGSSLVSYYLGLSYKREGKSGEAVKNLRDAVTLPLPVPEAYAELIESLYYLDEFKEARGWIAKAEKGGIDSARLAFLKGLVLAKEGGDKEAIESFQKAKGLDKTLTPSADFQIAILHARGRRLAEARESLKAVIAAAPTSEIAAFAREYESQISKLEGYNAWRLTAGVAYQYDDNVVLKPSAAIPDVIITGDRSSALLGTFQVDYTPLLRKPWLFNGRLDVYSDTYFSTHSHDIIAPTLTLTPGYMFQNCALTLPVLFSYIWLHERDYESVYSAKPTLSVMFRPGHIGQFSAGYARREMLQQELDPDENRDGDIYSAAAGYVHLFSGERGAIRLGYEFSRDITQGMNWDNTGNRIDISVLLPLAEEIRFALSGEAFLQDYRNTHSIFGVKRRDRTYFGSAGIIWDIVKAVSLTLQYSHTRADSNISIYAYNRNIYTVGIEYRF